MWCTIRKMNNKFFDFYNNSITSFLSKATTRRLSGLLHIIAFCNNRINSFFSEKSRIIKNLWKDTTTITRKIQTNRMFMSVYSKFRQECLLLKYQIHTFGLKSISYINTPREISELYKKSEVTYCIILMINNEIFQSGEIKSSWILAS